MLDRLIRSGDVLVDNFKQGTLDRWGFDDDWFEANAPAVIRCSITGYGSSGPKSEMPGYDFILQAETGLMAITGEPDGDPDETGSRHRRHLHRHAGDDRHPRRSGGASTDRSRSAM